MSTLVLYGGRILTMDPRRPEAAAIVIAGDRIVALLDDPADAPAGAARLDVEGRCVLPGFTDAHVHFPTWALARRELDLVGARSLAEALQRVAGARPAGGWVRGRGWRDELWPDGDAPGRIALDAVTGTSPAALRAHDSHSLWLNTAALALAGGDLETPGGVVERDAAGEPTGILREEAAWRFEARIAPGRDETLDAMRAALPAIAAAGVVAVHDKDGGRGAPELFAALRAAGELPLRVWQSVPATALGDAQGAGFADAAGDGAADAAASGAAGPGEVQGPGAADAAAAGAAGPADAVAAGDAIPAAAGGAGAADYVKAFMDGTLGSRTARLLDGTGVEITSSDELAGIVRAAAARGLPVAVHAIGDRANRDALDAFAATEHLWRPLGLRHRIEHAQCVHPDDVARFARLGVTASVQFTHATSDRDVADRLWGERAAHAYPYRALRDAGARLAGGSDAPIEALDPLAGLRAAVFRTADERPPWRPGQALDLDAALTAFTTAPAWLEGAEQRRGRLAPGLAADLVLLDRDPHDDLAGARVAGTMLAGDWLLGP